MLSTSIYRTLLRCYPGPFRDEYGAEMVSAFKEQVREARTQKGRLGAAGIYVSTVLDVFLTAPREHYYMFSQDLRYAFRTLASQPGFMIVPILSLALGIGANTALFSLLNSVLMRALPVRDPEALVMLTDPAASGVSAGSQRDERSLLTYSEFLQLRDQSAVFSSLMACQSQLERVEARVDGGEPEQLRSRLVSAEYFDTLGVPAFLGRTFSAQDDVPAPYAVISYDYWQRRLGRRADVLGTRMTIHQTVFSIIGVGPASFFGETVGERPDVWLPLTMQPAVLPGRDWLHDKPVDVGKVMWLHVFGRLRPGITMPKAQSAANIVFYQGLVAYYGSTLSAENAKESLNQRLKLRTAATGASQLRRDAAEPLMLLLAAAGLVLLIACANLGNLLLARGMSKTREAAVRLALGAGRSRLIRQSVTECLVLAFMGGIAGLAMAWLVRAGLLHLASASIDLPVKPDLRVLGFSFAVTVATGLLLGVLPALQAVSANVANGLKQQGRSMTGSVRWQRASRAIVAGQLALSLPLLIGAGLLLRTLINLQQVDLGYPKEALLTVEVDASTAGYDGSSQFGLYKRVLERLRSVPGVRAATFSNNGLFSGSDSGDRVMVEGYMQTSNIDRSSRYDHVGPNYFSTLGIPLLMGREINDQDQVSGRKVCVVNEAFVRQFFAGRNPLGMRVTQLYANQRNSFEIVGVARDSRMNSLRGNIGHRYYIPAGQPIFPQDSMSFAIRTYAEGSSVANGVGRAIQSLDPNLAVAPARPLEEIIDGRMAQDRLLARLSTAFGVVALLLAAIGLYGVLSFGVTRRTHEIGIRKALGARHGMVMALVFRETASLLVVGLLAGGAISALGIRFITTRLYGLAPTDPVTLGAALVVLALVAVAATGGPAYRAARVDANCTPIRVDWTDLTVSF